jgi:serine protease
VPYLEFNSCCLFCRGINLFIEKTLNCQASGGIAAIVFTNLTAIQGGAYANTSVTIPSYQIIGKDGMTIKSNFLNTNATIKGYRSQGYSGNYGSNAAAYVAGAIARIWRVQRNCTNTQVITCIKETAKDLGSVGRDDEFGYGLIQTRSAYQCLKRTNCSGI